MIKYSLLFVSASLLAQQADSTSAQNKNKIFVFVEQPPVFAGGQDAMIQYLSTNLKYPDEARKAKIGGKVFVQFVVESDGRVTNAEVRKGVNYQLDQEALRVIRSMPNWKPGMQGGKNVRTQFVLPLNFKVPQ